MDHNKVLREAYQYHFAIRPKKTQNTEHHDFGRGAYDDNGVGNDDYYDDYVDDDWPYTTTSNAMDFVKKDDDFFNTCVRYGSECKRHDDCCFGSCEFFSRLSW